MNQTRIKTAKAFFILSLASIVVCAVGGGVLYFERPWWVTFFILLGLMGPWPAWKFFSDFRLRRRERNFVETLVELEKAHENTLGENDREQSGLRRKNWRAAVLSPASLTKKRSCPLHALPWYVVIGESGSGKSTAIENAGLASMFAGIGGAPGVAGARDFDWWFFDEAIILDARREDAIPLDEGRDREQWRTFLSLLIRFRKKEPLNGLVAVIGADKLLGSRMEAIEENGRDIRRRIEELERGAGVRFPVYILVTKCDLIRGMTGFYDRLPDKIHARGMGFLNDDRSEGFAAFHRRASNAVVERLKDLRLMLLHDERVVPGGSIHPDLLLFPEEFKKLNAGLHAFMKGVFQDDPPRRTPFSRGIFYGSGKQEEAPRPRFLERMDLVEEREAPSEPGRGMFLFDLFSRILPADRGLVAPSRPAIPWEGLAGSIGLTLLIVSVMFFCGLLSYSFIKNMGAMVEVPRHFSGPGAPGKDIVRDLALMDRFRNAIQALEERNRSRWTPRLGLNQSMEVERRLKLRFCEIFKERFIGPFDERFMESLAVFSDESSDKTAARRIGHLVNRIHLSRARLNREPVETLLSMAKPGFHDLPYEGGRPPPADVRWKFAELYIHFLAWRLDADVLRRHMIDLRSWLKTILTEKRNDLNWLVTWADNESSLSGVSLTDFWGEASDAASEFFILPAYTRKGSDEIEHFIRKIERALPDGVDIEEQTRVFKERHRQAFVNAWRAFCVLFPGGAESLLGREQHRRVASRIVEGRGPYLSFLDRMALELESLSSAGASPSSDKKNPSPEWMNFVTAFKSARRQAEGMAEKEAGWAKGFLPGPGLEAGRAFDSFRKALGGITPAMVSDKAALEMAAGAFRKDSSAEASPLFKLARAENRLMRALARSGAADEMLTDLVSGPRLFLWDYVGREAACHLNHLWERDVLGAVRGVTDKKRLNELLIGPNGHAMKFIGEGPAEPFLSWSPEKKYHAREVMGVRLPFQPSFFTLLTLGAGSPMVASTEPPSPRPNYFVTVRALPTEANRNAVLQPHKTVLELHCAVGATLLVNYDFEVGKTFNWAPGFCGDVILKIGIGKEVLVKKYRGARGFPRFIKSFIGGRRTFYPPEFPDLKEALENLNVTHIRVGYRFDDAEVLPLLELFDREASALYNSTKSESKVSGAPALGRTIAACWIP